MVQPRKETFALTAVIQRVFAQGFRERIACRGAYSCDGEVGPKSLAVALRALFPLRGSAVTLVNASRNRSAYDWIGAERVEEVVVELRFLGRTRVRQSQLRLRRGCDGKTSALEESPESASDCAIANDGRAVRPPIASNKSISPRIFMSRSPSAIRKRVRPYSFSNLSKKER